MSSGGAAAYERWLGWYRSIAEKLEEPAHFSAFQSEADTLLKVIKWLMNTEQMAEAARLFCQVRLFLFGIGYWARLLDIAERVALWAEEHEEVTAFIAAVRSLLRIAREREDLSRMEELLERMRKLSIPMNSEVLEAEGRALVQVQVLVPSGRHVDPDRRCAGDDLVGDATARHLRDVHGLRELLVEALAVNAPEQRR